MRCFRCYGNRFIGYARTNVTVRNLDIVSLKRIRNGLIHARWRKYGVYFYSLPDGKIFDIFNRKRAVVVPFGRSFYRERRFVVLCLCRNGNGSSARKRCYLAVYDLDRISLEFVFDCRSVFRV